MARAVRLVASIAISLLFVAACGGDGGETTGEVSRSSKPTQVTTGEATGKIAFVAEQDGNFEIYVVNADGSGLKNLTNNPAHEPAEGDNEIANFDWSRDGSRITFTSDRDGGNPEIYVMDADGSKQTRLTTTPDFTETYPRWSPDGEKIAYVASGPYGPDAAKRIYVMNADGSEAKLLIDSKVWQDYPAWSPDGARIAFDMGDIYAVDRNGSGLVNLTSADDIGEGNEAYFAPVWSPDGSRIAFSAYRDSTVENKPGLYQQIYVVNVHDGEQIRVPEGANEDDYYFSPTWSPDGTRIVFLSDDEVAANAHVMDADGSNRHRITDDGAIAAVWSPDQSRIAVSTIKFVAGREPKIVVIVMNADGSDPTELTDTISDPQVVWSPVP